MRRGVIGFLLTIAGLYIALPALAADPKFAAGLGFDFATGDYGTDTTTDSIRVPLTLDYFPTPRLDLELVIPWLYQSSSTTTTFSGGMRFPTGDRRGMRQTSTTETTVNGEETETEAEDGLGDITLTAGYIVLPESVALPALRPLLYMKFPTADEEKGLGTGEFDIGGGLGVFKWFDRWYTFAEGRYIWQGENVDFELEDYGTLEGETGYLVTPNFLPTVALWWSSAPAESASDIMEARLKGKFWAGRDFSVEGYVGRGLSDETADFLGGLSVFYRF